MTKYFKPFPTIDIEDKDIRDITRRIVRADSYVNSLQYSYYIVKDGEKLEDLAYRFYGDPNLHWVLMLFNAMTDPIYDFPLSETELTRYIETKYSDPDGIHHYESSGDPDTEDGVWTTSDSEFALPVTNREYETILNDGRRQIRVPSSQLLAGIIKTLKEKIVD